MTRFMAKNSKWLENIFYGQRGANMARLEKSGHQMARLATLISLLTGTGTGFSRADYGRERADVNGDSTLQVD